MKKIIVSILILFSLTACVQTNLNDILESIEFDTNESTAIFSIVNFGEVNNQMSFEYTISEKNEFVKTVKIYNTDVETNIIYKNNNNYYLYQEKNDNIVNIELTEYDAKIALNSVVLERDELYTISTETTEYSKKTSDGNTCITYEERLDDVLYSIDVSFNTSNNQFVSLQRKYTVDNTMTTISLFVSYELDLSLPQGVL